MSRELDDAEELLLDLQHDLGKYVRMPLNFLPAGASDEEVREAIKKALAATKQSQGRALSARELWDRFENEATPPLRNLKGFTALRSTVEKALAWEAALNAPTPIDRKAAEADLSAVASAIRALVAELGQTR